MPRRQADGQRTSACRIAVLTSDAAERRRRPKRRRCCGMPLCPAPPTGEQKSAPRGGSRARRRPTTIAIRRAPTRRSGSDGGSRISDASATRSTPTRAASRGIPPRRGCTATAGIATSRSRKFDLAIADLTTASQLVAGKPDEIEPDGAPNKAGIPRSTLQSNIWYHLGLAQYLRGDFTAALASYREGMKVSRVNDDMLVATSDWLYMTLRRLKRDAEARQVLEPIREQMDVLENGALSRAAADVQRAAHAGVGAEPQHRRRHPDRDAGLRRRQLVSRERRSREGAASIFDRVLAGKAWTAFGFIAAEADVKRGF